MPEPTPIIPPTVKAKVTEWVISQIRTTIGPVIGGALLNWLLKLGIEVEGETLNMIVFSACTAVWYAIVRAVEVAAESPTVRKWAGILLGYAKPPVLRASAGAVIDVEAIEKRDG